MKSLITSLWLLILLLPGCGRGPGTTGGQQDTIATPASETTTTAPVSGKPEILAVTVRIRTADGGEGDLQVDLDKTEGSDAIFFSLDAVRNFVVPFYTARKGEGPDSAAAIMKDATAQMEKNGFIILLHKLRCKVLIPRDLLREQFPRKI